jgi:quercetin dioxygenase-like cupin family protein
MRPAVSLSISLSVFLLATATNAGAQEKHQIIAADAIQWGDGPPNLPAGAKMAVLSGDPGKRGLYVVRAKMPDGYAVPAHWHRKAEYVTVLSGTLNVGMGDKLDKSKAEAVKAGGFFSAEPRMRHYAWAAGETVIEISGMGPFDIQYVDKNDDPLKGKKRAR